MKDKVYLKNRLKLLENELLKLEKTSISYRNEIEILKNHLFILDPTSGDSKIHNYGRFNQIPQQIMVNILTYFSSDTLFSLLVINQSFRMIINYSAKIICLERFQFKEAVFYNSQQLSNSIMKKLYELEKNIIVVFSGGSFEEPCRSDRTIFDTQTKEWRSLSCMDMSAMHKDFNRRTEFETIYSKGQVLIFSDFSTINVRNGRLLEICDIMNCKWHVCPSLGIFDKLFNMSLTVYKGQIISTGGICKDDRQNEKLLDSIHIIDYKYYNEPVFLPKNLTIRLPSPRSHHGSILFNGELWVVGGKKFLSRNEVESTTEILSSLDGHGTWRSGPSLKVIRDDGPKLAVIANNLYAIGGDFDVVDDMRSTIEVLDLQKNQWKVIGQFKEQRAFYSVAVVHEKVYIFGGIIPEISDNHTYLNTWDAYDCINSYWESDFHPEYDYKFAGRMPHRDAGYALCKAEAVPRYYNLR